MKLFGRKRDRAGITMTELLAVLAVIAVLLAVAIPSLGALREHMKMNELDAAAQSIFAAAQVQLTAMGAADTLGSLQNASEYESAADTGRRCYLSSDDATHAALLAQLLPTGMLEPRVAGNHFVIQFNQTYGAALAVFYAEAALPPVETLFPLRTDVAERKQQKIGFFDGEDAAYEPVDRLPKPQLEVENKEELRVKITVPHAISVLRSAELYLVINTEAYKIPPADLTDKGYTWITLDSLHAGKQFKDLYKSFTPGEQLTISAELRPIAGVGDDLITSTSEKITTNSLFADHTDGVVEIAYARHLQNLATAVSGINTGTNHLIYEAIQTQDITWPDEYVFVPIYTRWLYAYDGGSLEIRDLRITKTSNRGYSGLFAELSFPEAAQAGDWNRLENIRLVNPVMTISGDVNGAGMLIGKAWGVRILNCEVYAAGTQSASGLTLNANTNTPVVVGGLVGIGADCEIVNSFAALPFAQLHGGITGSHFGGLIGTAKGCTMRASYAVIDEIRGSFGAIAAFAGETSNGLTKTTVSNCYAVADIRAKATEYYGFMGGIATARNAYAAVTYQPPKGETLPLAVYPFSKGVATDCAYLALGSDVTVKNKVAEALTHRELTAWRGGDAAAWTMLSPAQSHPYRATLIGRAYPYPALNRQDVQVPLAIAHHGSWPAAPQAWLAYYEFYNGATAPGLYLAAQENNESAPVVDTLKKPGEADTVRQDGYTLLSSVAYEVPPQAVWLDDGAAEARVQTVACEAYAQNPVVIGDQNYYLYLLPKQALLVAPSATNLDFYRPIVCAGTEFWFNPHFPAPTGLTAPKDPDVLRVRSARQLADLGSYNRYWNRTVNQELMVDFDSYSYLPNLQQPCIGNESKPFTGHYEGRGDAAEIVNLPLQTDGNVGGLFGVVGAGGSVTNLSITPKSMVFSASTANAGFLVGKNEGALRDCKVNLRSGQFTVSAALFGCMVGENAAGGSISNGAVTGSDAVVTGAGNDLAGFVGRNAGAVTASRVQAVGSYHALTLKTKKNVAGFVSQNTADGNIKTSYAVLRVEGDQNAAGFAAENQAAISQCYANSEVRGGLAASGFVGVHSGAALSDCYALLHVTSDQKAAGFSAATTTGTFTNCYAAAHVKSTAGTTYGFAPTNGNQFVNSFYRKASYLTAGQGGVAKTDGELGGLFTDNANWRKSAADAQPFTASLGNTYPFMCLAQLLHIGDWPTQSTLPLPPSGEELIGVFHYVYDKTTQTVTVTGAGIDCAPDSNKCPVNREIPNFFNGLTFPVDTEMAGTLSPQGCGVYWTKGMSEAMNSNKMFYYNNVTMGETNGEIILSDAYHFVPINQKTTNKLAFKHSQGGGGAFNWEYTFDYNTTTDKFTLTKTG